MEKLKDYYERLQRMYPMSYIYAIVNGTIYNLTDNNCACIKLYGNCEVIKKELDLLYALGEIRQFFLTVKTEED